MVAAAERATAWWVSALERRAADASRHGLELGPRPEWASEKERSHAEAFFNAALRAEESGSREACELASTFRKSDPELARALDLYAAEEGWHYDLLTHFLPHIGATIQPMGRVTSAFQRLHARARRAESILLINLLFEAIGSTTYRLALGRVRDPSARSMLKVLARDEAFHVPLNAHFLRRVLARSPPASRRGLRVLSCVLFASLVLLPLASRRRAGAFDGLGVRELSRAYALALARLFLANRDLALGPPRFCFRFIGLRDVELTMQDPLLATAGDAAERAERRDDVVVRAL